MDTIEILFLVPILLLGIITSYTDIKTEKIKNKALITFLIIGISLNLIIFTIYFLSGTLRWIYVLEFFSNTILATTIGFLFYYFNIWSSGDGKLFAVFAILTPLSIYSIDYIPGFPSIVILINTFLVAFFIIACSLILKITKQGMSLKNIREKLVIGNPKQAIVFIIQIFSLMWLIQIFLNFLNLELNHYINFMLIFILLSSLKKILTKFNKTLIVLSISRLVLDKSIYSTDFLTQFLIYSIGFYLIMNLGMKTLDYLSILFFTREIKSNKLKKGMILSDIIITPKNLTKKDIKKLKEQNIEYVKYKTKYYIKYKNGETTEQNILSSRTLTEKNIKTLKQLGFKNYSISETTSFSHFIFIGTIITYLTNQTAISLIKNLL